MGTTSQTRAPQQRRLWPLHGHRLRYDARPPRATSARLSSFTGSPGRCPAGGTSKHLGPGCRGRLGLHPSPPGPLPGVPAAQRSTPSPNAAFEGRAEAAPDETPIRCYRLKRYCEKALRQRHGPHGYHRPREATVCPHSSVPPHLTIHSNLDTVAKGTRGTLIWGRGSNDHNFLYKNTHCN